MPDLVKFSLTVDVEGEWLELPNEQSLFDIDKVVFAVEKLEHELIRIQDSIGQKIAVTWFFRCDDSVAYTTGKLTGLVQRMDRFIGRCLDKGDDLGFHPHLYQNKSGKWKSEIDPIEQCKQIDRSVSAWTRHFGSRPNISRMGEALMNPVLAEHLDSVGIQIDSSALPGRKRYDSGFQFDWSITPEKLYRPSKEDYRREVKKGENHYGYTEIPFTMLRTKSSIDEREINRYCNLAYRPDIVSEAIKKMKDTSTIVSVVHPHELLPSGRSHAIISNEMSSLSINIKLFLDRFPVINFVTLSDLAATTEIQL